MPAESAILQAGVEAAMVSSVFDSPSATCSKTGEDVFIGLGSTEAMGGATLRDIYAKAWEVSDYARMHSNLCSAYLSASQRASYLDASRAGRWCWGLDLDIDACFICGPSQNQEPESFRCVGSAFVGYRAFTVLICAAESCAPRQRARCVW
jgi:hypothetical protein